MGCKHSVKKKIYVIKIADHYCYQTKTWLIEVTYRLSTKGSEIFNYEAFSLIKKC